MRGDVLGVQILCLLWALIKKGLPQQTLGCHNKHVANHAVAGKQRLSRALFEVLTCPESPFTCIAQIALNDDVLLCPGEMFLGNLAEEMT